MSYVGSVKTTWITESTGVAEWRNVDVTAHGNEERKFIPVDYTIEKMVKQEPFRFKKGISKK